jgi:hypothetical protein
MAEPIHTSALVDGLHRLPAPHDRVEFRITAYGKRCVVGYSGSVEDLISANVVTPELLMGKSGRIPIRGRLTRRDKAGGKIRLTYLKYELVVYFLDALERGLTLPGVTDEIIAAAKAEEAAAYEARRHEAPAEEPESQASEPITPETYLQAAAVPLKNLIDIADHFSPALSARVGVYLARIDELLRIESAKRITERPARSSFLKLVVDNTQAARP